MIGKFSVKDLTAALAMIAVSVGSARTASASPTQTYLAIGDSFAFGETDFSHDPSYGDRGYVKPFDTYLGTQQGGVAPKVINLGVDGETSTTFLNGGPPSLVGSAPGQPGYLLNSHYGPTDQNQNAMMLKTIVHEQALGHTISNVTVSLGANDLFVTVGSPGFMSLTPAQQQAKIGAALMTLAANDTTILSELHSLLPNAHVYLLGYYNPFAAAPNSPMGMLAGPAIQALNGLIAQEASAFGAKFVDVSSAIKGHELQDTYIASGNVHPNAAGYQAIAGQLVAAATPVPEPSTALMLVTGLGGWFALGRRRALRRSR